MKRTLLCLLLGLGWAGGLFAQTPEQVQRRALDAISKPGSSPAWLWFRDETRLQAADFFKTNAGALGLGSDDELRLVRTEHDELDMIHYRYQQYHAGYRVEGADYLLHEQNGRLVTANGKLATPGTWPAHNSILPEATALQQALTQMPSKQFLWLDKQAELQLQLREHNSTRSYFPVGELVWLMPSTGESRSSLHLAWKFNIATGDGRSETLYLDAATGTVLRRIPLDINCDPGSGATTWNGTVNFSTDQSGGNFILLDDCQSPNLHVFNSNDSSSLSFATEYTDADNNWTGQTSAIQTYFGIHQAWQYYATQFSRNSYDNSGATVNAYNQAGFKRTNGTTYWSNASWSNSQEVLRFGDNGTNTAGDDWNTVDIVGHEFTHAVTHNSADLDYVGESGALNESFSDIFGEMVELFTIGTQDWLAGNDRGAIRDYANPNNFNDPDTYQGTNWVSTSGTCDGTNDQCGVHTNSGVQNHWFYLLSMGGTGTNDNGDAYKVQGIGSTNAAAIAYRNLTTYLGSSSDYAAAKAGSIQAASDLFGSCSNQVLQCARAWNAVGVNSSDGFGYDILTDCSALGFLHDFGALIALKASNDIRSDCAYNSNGTSIVYEAGHVITLKPGFRSGDNFRAFINPCSGAGKPVVPGNPATIDRQTPVATTAVVNHPLIVFPNPFHGNLSIQFELPAAAPVTCQLLDAFGQRVQIWYDQQLLEAGRYQEQKMLSDLPPGLYILELQTPAGHWTEKVVKVGG